MRCGEQVCLSRGARVRSAIRRRTEALGVVDAGSVDCGQWPIRKPDDNHKRALSARGAAAQRLGWRIRGGGTARRRLPHLQNTSCISYTYAQCSSARNVFSQPCHVLLWRPRAYDAETILLCNDILQGRREARLTGVRPKLGNLAKELNNLAGWRAVPAPKR